jgi:membrane protein
MLRYLYRVIIGTIRGFIHDECFYKASALTFYTLLSIVPIFAIAFGVAKGFGLEKYIEQELSARLLDQPQITHQIIIFANAVIANAHGGVIAIFGLIGLVWTMIQLFTNIELSLNFIWKVKSRTFMRQIRDYISMILFGTLLFVASSALSLIPIGKFNAFFNHALIIISPFIVNWFLFSCIYYFIPNTKVKLRYALTGGIAAGTFYQLIQWIYINFQIGVASYGAIYGSFAALPLFLVWVNTSWTIVLAGAELAYHLEITPKIPRNYSFQYASKKQIGLWLTSHCAEEFMNGNPPIMVSQIEHESGLPQSVIKSVAQILCAEGILDEDQQQRFIIAKNPDDIKIKEVLEAFDKNEEKFAIAFSPQFVNLFENIEEDVDLYDKSIKEISLKKEGQNATN